MFLHGFELGGYRSFGGIPQKVAPLQKVNLIVGQNNSGKSNILRFTHHHLREVLDRAKSQNRNELGFGLLDSHQPGPVPFQFAISFLARGGPVLKAVSEWSQGRPAEEILGLLMEEDDLAWVHFRSDHLGKHLKLALDPAWINKVIERSRPHKINWRSLAMSWTGGSSSKNEENVARVLRRIVEAIPQVPAVSLVPAIRQIGAGELATDDFSGIDIIRRLADLQHPSIHQQHKKDQFRALNSFVRTVLDDKSAEIEVPDAKDTLHIKVGKSVLPVESLGTGIHEVTMLGAWATILTDQIVCIEEPELHLHPILQRKLLAYLANKTSNQYLITTHSAHLLDSANAAILHVRWNQEDSAVERAKTSEHRVKICADLGYRASDLLQANAVVWVEGPSDRIYLRHWLAEVAPDLIEGVHYSLMFYGGRLLSHLSANDVEVNDFIALRAINRYLTIVIDSDRPKSGRQMNATKLRVRSEFDNGPGFAWITDGREIENYVPPSLVLKAIQTFRADAIKLTSVGRYDQIYRFKGRNGVESADKVKLAHAIASHPADLSDAGLRKQVKSLATFIASANGSGR